ncbi:unnamed protein product [Bodo saltans]|uniref:Uncharacterized protein n=1 Tax=Bodo saltans TaxID=75058 RepID=A0A0S4J861_BODSA|nr:unnamed protein product [Bodo saltans]|eukprot:CUG65321.1 unnamed protein product [Bodo saltans]
MSHTTRLATIAEQSYANWNRRMDNRCFGGAISFVVRSNRGQRCRTERDRHVQEDVTHGPPQNSCPFDCGTTAASAGSLRIQRRHCFACHTRHALRRLRNKVTPTGIEGWTTDVLGAPSHLSYAAIVASVVEQNGIDMCKKMSRTDRRKILAEICMKSAEVINVGVASIFSSVGYINPSQGVKLPTYAGRT